MKIDEIHKEYPIRFNHFKKLSKHKKCKYCLLAPSGTGAYEKLNFAVVLCRLVLLKICGKKDTNCLTKF